MIKVTNDDIVILQNVYEKIVTLKEILISSHGDYGIGYNGPIPEEFDAFLSSHLVAFNLKDSWNDEILKFYVKSKPLQTLIAYYNLKFQKSNEFHPIQSTRNYYNQFPLHFETFFNLLEPSRRSLFCFIFSCSLFVHFGNGNFLIVGGRNFPDSKEINYLWKSGKINIQTSSSSDPKICELLVPVKTVKKGSFSHKYSAKGFSNIHMNKLLYQPSIKKARTFLHKFDSTGSLLPIIFGSVLPQGAIVEYRDHFESIKINHMTFEFNRVMNQVAGKVRIKKDKQKLDSLVQMFTPHQQVCEFMRRVFFYVFPRQLFGSNQNRQKFYRGLKLIITSPRISKIRFTNVSRGLNYKTIMWLDIGSKHPSQGYFIKFTQFVISYILDLLRSFFYVTETQFARNENVFYRKEIWRRIYLASTDKMTEEQGRIIPDVLPLKRKHIAFRKASINATKYEKRKRIMLKKRKIYPTCRVIPKKSSVRIICPNNAFAPNSETSSAIKAIIRSMRKVKTSRGRYEDLTRLIYWCKTMHLHKMKLYMIKGDIKDCYPSINQDLLVSIIRNHLNELYGSPQPDFVDVFLVDLVNITRRKHFTNEVYITPCGPSDSLFSQIKELYPDIKNTFIIPKKTIKLNKPELLIRDLVKANVVAVNDRKCVEIIQGVRQGDPISCDLAALYMEHYIEEIVLDLLHSYSDGPRASFAYSADDMIFASIDKEFALDILSRISRPFVKYNLQANFSKLQVNFHQSICSNVNVNRYLSFCGFKIDSFDFAVFGDYSTFNGCHIKYTFDSNQFKPVKEVRSHLVSQISMLRPFCLDPYINSNLAIAKNLYERVYFQGLRFAYYLLASPVYRVKQVPCQIVSFTVSIIRRIIRRKKVLTRRDWTISNLQVAFITVSALHHLWTSHGSLYTRKKERMFYQRYLRKLQNVIGDDCEFSQLTPSRELTSIKISQ